MKPVSRAEITDLQQIPNIGPSIAANLRLIGVLSPKDLLGKDPYTMYDELCDITGVRHDALRDRRVHRRRPVHGWGTSKAVVEVHARTETAACGQGEGKNAVTITL